MAYKKGGPTKYYRGSFQLKEILNGVQMNDNKLS